MEPKVIIEKMITIDDTGMPIAPSIRQLQDKDVVALWERDKSTDKRQYLAEAGVIFYLGDPKSPARQQGCNDGEALKMAIDNYNLPKDYTPDALVTRIIKKYYTQNITEAGVALEALQKSVHLVALAATKMNDYLNNKLQNPIGDDTIVALLPIMQQVSKQVQEIPSLTKAISTAYENLRTEQEEQMARGGKQILSSMDADEGQY